MYLVESTQHMAEGVAELSVLIKAGAKQVRGMLEKSKSYSMFVRRVFDIPPLAIEETYHSLAGDDSKMEF